MKKIFLALSLMLLVSCNGQTDLETLEFGKPFPAEKLKTYQKDTETFYDLPIYSTKQLGDYKLGDVSFSTYELPNGYLYAYNNIDLVIDDHNNYLGFTLYNYKNEEGKKLLDYLKKTYGKPEERQTLYDREVVYFWDVAKENKWMFFNQKIQKYDDGRENLETRLTVIKKGTRVGNSSDPTFHTVLESFTLANPKL